jgi:1-deoxy-D-xylulose-5-phosphate reductoisomerase
MDLQRFPGLQLAYDCTAAPEGSTTVLNAANEVAVQAFLAGASRFTAIHEVNCRTLQSVAGAGHRARQRRG